MSYVNIKGISDLIGFGEVRIVFSETPLRIFVYVNPGYSHSWNQYEGGTGTEMLDFGLGGSFILQNFNKVVFPLGLLTAQMTTYVSSKIGYTF